MHIITSRTRGSVFLLVVVAVVFVVVLGYVLSHVIRFLRRVDGMQDRRFSETNAAVFTTPPGVASVQVQNRSMTWEWWDLPYNPPADAPKSLAIDVQSITLEIVMDTNGLARLGFVDAGLTTNRGWAGLGVALDEWGMPQSQYWIANAPTAPQSVPWTLQRSEDMTLWTNLVTLQLQTNVPQWHQDDKRDRAFYRMMR